MKFTVIESKHKNLFGVIEGESFDDVLETIGKMSNIKSTKLHAFGETQNNGLMRYSIYKGNRRIAILKQEDE